MSDVGGEVTGGDADSRQGQGMPCIKLERGESGDDSEEIDVPKGEAVEDDGNDDDDDAYEEDEEELEEDYVPEKKKRKTVKRKAAKSTSKRKAPSPTPPRKPVLNFDNLSLKIIPMQAVKRVSLSLKEKIEIIERIEGGESQNKVATLLKLNRGTVQGIWSSREKLRTEASSGNWTRRKLRKPNNETMDNLVLSWVEHQRGQGTPPNGTQIREHARIIAKGLGDTDFTASHGWLDHFKRRNKLILPKSRRHDRMLEEIMRKEQEREKTDQAGVPDDDDSAGHWDAGDMWESPSPVVARKSAPAKPISNMKKAAETRKQSNMWLGQTWPKICNGYSPENIFFINEFGLFYRRTPEDCKLVQGLSCFDGELASERFSVLFGVNAVGTERLKLVVVGGSHRPSSFGEWSEKDQEKLPTEYWFHPKAVITPDIIASWISRWNTQLESAKDGRKVLVVMSQSKVHQTVENLCSALGSVKICIPTGLGAGVLRYLESDISAEVKWNFKKLFVNYLMRKPETSRSEKITVLEATGLLHTAWLGIQANLIGDIFKRSGLVKGEYLAKKKRDDSSSIKSLVQEAKRIGIPWPKDVTFQSFVDIEENLVAMDMSVGLLDRDNVVNDDGTSPYSIPSQNGLMNHLDQLRTWAVLNQSGDLRVLHDAISMIQNFCVTNIPPSAIAAAGAASVTSQESQASTPRYPSQQSTQSYTVGFPMTTQNFANQQAPLANYIISNAANQTVSIQGLSVAANLLNQQQPQTSQYFLSHHNL